MKADARRDLIGGSVFWGAAGLTLVSVLFCFVRPSSRAWIGLAVLLMWTAFSVVNALRVRRLHSIVSAPVYLAAAAALLGSALGRLEVQIWMIWLLGAGIIAANLSERVFGKYL